MFINFKKIQIDILDFYLCSFFQILTYSGILILFLIFTMHIVEKS